MLREIPEEGWTTTHFTQKYIYSGTLTLNASSFKHPSTTEEIFREVTIKSTPVCLVFQLDGSELTRINAFHHLTV